MGRGVSGHSFLWNVEFNVFHERRIFDRFFNLYSLMKRLGRVSGFSSLFIMVADGVALHARRYLFFSVIRVCV